MKVPERLQGIGVFGPAYRRGYEERVHAVGSVDRIIRESMILIHSDTMEILYGDAPVRVRESAPNVLSDLKAIFAVGRLSKDRMTRDAEFSILVADAWQKHGLGLKILTQ